MSRKGTVLLALLAAMAMSAIAASAASAAPEFTKVKDKFTTSSGASELKGAITIKCSKDSGSGETTSSTTVSATVSFEGCKGEILGGKCPETITSKLVGTLGTVAKEEATSETGLDFKPASGPFAEFKCGIITIKVEGSAAGEVTPVKTKAKVGDTVFALNGSAQKIKKIVINGKTEEPKLTAFGSGSTISTVEENTFVEELETT